MAEFIPRAPLPQVQVDRGPQVRNTVRYDDSGGQAIAEALGGIGQQVRDYAQKQIEQEDAAALLAARRELSDWEHSTFDPDNPEGISKFRGLNALGANEALLPDLDKRVAAISERLAPRQRQQFESLAGNFRDGVGNRLNGYMDREHTAARTAEAEASIGSLLRDAATAGMNGDMDRQEELLAELQAANEVRFTAAGQGQAVVAQSNRAAVSSVRRQTIESVATADPFRAQEMLGQYRDQLAPEDRAHVESVLYPVVEDAQAAERFEAWIGGAPGANPNSYRDPGARGNPSPEVRRALDEAADANGIPREYLYALAEQESSFNPRAVGPEVQAEEPVPVHRAVIAVDDEGLDEFVRLAPRIGVRHGQVRRQRGFALPRDDGAIGAFHPFPAVVAVHRVIAADDRADPRAFGHRPLQFGDKAHRGLRRHVAAVGDRVQDDRHACPGDGANGGLDMDHMAMHASVGHHAHQMRRPARGTQPLDKPHKAFVAHEAAVLDRKVDLAQIHRDDAARADIGMAHLGIAHLPARQSDVGAEGGQGCVRTIAHQPVEVRRRGLIRRALFGPVGQAPAVKNAQDHRFRHVAPRDVWALLRLRRPSGNRKAGGQPPDPRDIWTKMKARRFTFAQGSSGESPQEMGADSPRPTFPFIPGDRGIRPGSWTRGKAVRPASRAPAYAARPCDQG